MSVFTTVTRPQLAAFLAAYGSHRVLEFEGIATGIENSNYFLTTDAGRYVLTIYETVSAQQLPYFHDLMHHLAAAGMPCARALPDRRGRRLGELCGRPAALIERLPGAPLQRVGPLHCRQVGALVARLHRAAADFPHRRANPRGVDWLAQSLERLQGVLNAEDLELAATEAGALRRLAAAGLPAGPVHLDLFRENLLFSRGRLSGVVDFYFACNDSLVYDLAIAVNDWCRTHDCRLDSARVKALLGAYHRERAWSAGERAAWGGVLRAAALRFWVSREIDLHFPRPGDLTHAKDPEVFKRLLRWLRGAGRGTALAPTG